MQKIDTGRVSIVREVSVHLKVGWQIRDITCAFFWLHHELFAVMRASNEANTISNSASLIFSLRNIFDHGNAINGQAMEPIVQLLITLDDLREIEEV